MAARNDLHQYAVIGQSDKILPTKTSDMPRKKHPKGVKKGGQVGSSNLCTYVVLVHATKSCDIRSEVKASFKHPSLHAAIENHVQANTNHIAT